MNSDLERYPEGDTSTSSTLVAGCRSGDKESWGELQAFLRPVLQRWARRARRAGAPEFDDFFNACWVGIQAGVRNGGYVPGTSLRAWVGGLARNVIHTLSRERSRSARAELPADGPAIPDPLEREFEDEWNRELRSRALQLTEAQTPNSVDFRAFVMRCLEGAEYPIIVAHLGLGTGKESMRRLHNRVDAVRKRFEVNIGVLHARMS